MFVFMMFGASSNGVIKPSYAYTPKCPGLLPKHASGKELTDKEVAELLGKALSAHLVPNQQSSGRSVERDFGDNHKMHGISDFSTKNVFVFLEAKQKGEFAKIRVARSFFDEIMKLAPSSGNIKKPQVKSIMDNQDKYMVDKFDSLQDKIDSIKLEHINNIDKLISKGENLDTLMDGVEDMKEEAFETNKLARKAKKKSFLFWPLNVLLPVGLVDAIMDFKDTVFEKSN